MLIYCNGDSFTEGHELGDEVMPGWPGYQHPKDAMFTRDNWFTREYFDSISKMSKEQAETRIRLQHQRRWPTLLAAHLEADVVNGAVAGASMEGVTARTILDIERLLAEDKKIDHVFLMLPLFDRKTIYDTTRIDPVICIIPGYLHHQRNEDKKILAKAWAVCESEEDSCFRCLSSIVQVRSYVKDKLGYYPTLLLWDSLFYDKLICNAECTQLLRKVSTVDCIPKEFQFSQYSLPNQLVCPGGHYAPPAHEKFATAIYQKMTKGLTNE